MSENETPATDARWTAEVQDWYDRWLDKLIRELKDYTLRDADGSGTDRRAFLDDQLPLMRAWYASQGRRFCTWIEPLERRLYPGDSYDTYHSDDFWRERPHWTVEWDSLLEARGEAIDAARAAESGRWCRERDAAAREREAARYPTLDAFLARGVRVTGAYWVPTEPNAITLLDDEAYERLGTQRERLPRYCRGCGDRFDPKPRHAVRCSKCRNRGTP